MIQLEHQLEHPQRRERERDYERERTWFRQNKVDHAVRSRGSFETAHSSADREGLVSEVKAQGTQHG